MKVKTIIVFIFITLCLTVNVSAQTTYDIEKEIESNVDIKSFYDALPDEASENIDQNILDESSIVSSAKNIDGNIIGNYLKNSLINTVRKTIPALYPTIITLIVISLINTVKNSFSDKSVSKTIELITSAVIILCLHKTLHKSANRVGTFLECTNTLINALLPTMTALYTLGGNASAVITNNASFSFIITFVNFIIQYMVTPILSISLGLTVASRIGKIKGCDKVNSLIKNFITVTLTTVVTLFSVFLLFKTNLSVATDGFAARTIKFAGSFIPVIGSPLGETVRSVLSSLSLIKSSTGYVGIFIVFATTFPTLLHLIISKVSFELISAFAHILGNEKEGDIIKDLSAYYGYLLAVVFSVVILFIFELIIFINISPALARS